MSDPLVDLEERVYVSRFATDTLGIQIHVGGALADPDGNTVLVTMTKSVDDAVVFADRVATRAEVGVYQFDFLAADTATAGFYTLTWNYTVGGVAQFEQTFIEVGFTSPAYDALPIGFKGIVESVWERFADLYDSPFGGPHLQVYAQTRFGRGRLAQLLRIAVGRLNTFSQPHMTYTIDSVKPFPYDQWGPLLEQALYIEALKHLIRSYVEQPSNTGLPVTVLERRDYMNRWADVLAVEQESFDPAVEVFKIAHMGLGRGRVLVSGGVYGRFGPTRLPNSAAARPRYWTRWYAILLIAGFSVGSLGWQDDPGSRTHQRASGFVSISGGQPTEIA